MFISFRTAVEKLGRAGLFVMTKGVRFELLMCVCGFIKRFLTWDDTFP